MIVSKFIACCVMCDISVCPRCHWNDKDSDMETNEVCKKCSPENGINFQYRGDKLCVDFIN
jgi:hypothetical protein